MVEYDSIIPPGREGKIVQQVKLSSLSGAFSKSVRVLSNAQNNGEVVLTLAGKIMTDVQPSHKWINLKPDSTGKYNGFLAFSTEKKDFKITEMVFDPQKKENLPLWQQNQPITIAYTQTKSDSADVDGYFKYSLNFTLNIPPVQELMQGQFTFKTNHPKTGEIRLKGMINPEEKVGTEQNPAVIPDKK